MTEAHGASAPTQDEVQALLRKAEKGDRTVLPGTARLYGPHPWLLGAA